MKPEVVLQRAETEIVPIIESNGYEVVEVKYVANPKENILTFFIYKKGGVTIDDCENVNAILDEPLERLDITDGESYTLNISSPGLDRPVVSDKDFERNIGEELEAHFHKLVDKKKKVVGILISYTPDTFTLEVKGSNKVYERTNIKSLKPYIKF